jgi:hypothetical protein
MPSPYPTGVEVEIQSTNADTPSVALSSLKKVAKFQSEDNDVVASFVIIIKS